MPDLVTFYPFTLSFRAYEREIFNKEKLKPIASTCINFHEGVEEVIPSLSFPLALSPIAH